MAFVMPIAYEKTVMIEPPSVKQQFGKILSNKKMTFK